MTCFANNEGVERLLRDIFHELRQINSKLTPPPPPSPLPLPATKDFVAGIPDEFLVITEYGDLAKYTKVEDKGWDVCTQNRNKDFVFDSRVGDEQARQAWDEAEAVWVKYAK